VKETTMGKRPKLTDEEQLAEERFLKLLRGLILDVTFTISHRDGHWIIVMADEDGEALVTGEGETFAEAWSARKSEEAIGLLAADGKPIKSAASKPASKRK
jgi:hypothetical protein